MGPLSLHSSGVKEKKIFLLIYQRKTRNFILLRERGLSYSGVLEADMLDLNSTMGITVYSLCQENIKSRYANLHIWYANGVIGMHLYYAGMIRTGMPGADVLDFNGILGLL